MGFRLIGAIIVFTLLAIGLYWVINRVWPTNSGETPGDGKGD